MRHCVRHIEEIVAGTLIAALCITVGLQVFSRFVLHDPYIWAEEVSRLLFIWASFFGAAVALKQNRHFAVDLLIIRLEEKGGTSAEVAHRLRQLVAVFMILLLATLLWKGFSYVVGEWRTRTDILEISVGWTYLPLPLSCLAMIVRALPMLVGRGGTTGTAESGQPGEADKP